MKILVCAAAILAVVFGCGMSAGAWTFSDVVWSGSTGTGSNTSYFVVDFGPVSHAYSYSYDGSKFAYDMITDLSVNAPSFTADLGYFDGFGHYVNNFTAGGDTATTTDLSWWAYYLSGDGHSWNFSGQGMDLRVLSNGSWDGWAFQPDYNLASTEPKVPTVPEPSSLVCLAAVLGMAFSNRKRS